MSDINCPNCGEPWDTYHLRHDEPWEWDLSEEEIKRVCRSGFNGPKDPARKAAEEAGWEFVGNSTLAFVKCPCCPSDGAEGGILKGMVEENKAKVEILSDLLGDDEDALQVELEDLYV